jgi:hypothetical protein
MRDVTAYEDNDVKATGSMQEKLTIIVTGYAATYPVGGATWDYLQYVLGFKRLGHRVYYVEDTGRWTWDVARNSFSDDARANAAYLAKWFAALDPELAQNWALRDVHGHYYGMSQAQVARLCRETDVFINYSGSCVLREEYMRCRTKVYLDTDPLYNQAGVVDYVRGTADDQTRWAVDYIRQHDHFLSFAENIGQPHCTLPTALFTWKPTRQPIVLDYWTQPTVPVRDRFTTIMAWQPDGGEITVDGVVYGGKHAEFSKVMHLPQRTSQALELAIGGGLPPTALLREHGWHVVEGYPISADPWKYRAYIRASKAEFSVAKQAYVATQSGWFSCRSACYLAAGKPVVVQDTGFSTCIPTGKGILAFSTEEEALEAIERVNREYPLHAAAALGLAREYFAASQVLPAFLRTVLG